MNPTKEEIIKKLKYRASMNYNALWDKKGNSSQFAYNLKDLINKGFVKKNKTGYSLTIKGIKFSDYLSLPSPQPIQTIILVCKKDNKVLLNTRTKYPYRGYQEFCASKLKFNETIFEAAKERLNRKLGLKGNPVYRGIEFLQTKENKELVMHHHLHIFLVENPKGTPKKGTWVEAKPFNPKKPLPHITQTLKIALSNKFEVAVTDMIKQEEKFVDFETSLLERF